MVKIFHSKEEVEKYADKNYFSNTYKIEETRNGNFRIEMLEVEVARKKNIKKRTR